MLFAGLLGVVFLLVVVALLLPTTLTLAVDLPLVGGHTWPTGPTIASMVLFAALCGLGVGGVIGRNLLPAGGGPGRWQAVRTRLMAWWLTLRRDTEARTMTIGAIALACLLLGAVFGQTSFAGAVLVAAFGTCAVFAAARAIKLLESQDVAVHAQWGGLGGGLGGWRLSRPASLMILAAVFAGAAVTVLATTTGRDTGQSGKPEQAKAAGGSTANPAATTVVVPAGAAGVPGGSGGPQPEHPK